MKVKILIPLFLLAMGAQAAAETDEADPTPAYIVSATGLGAGGVAQVGNSCGHDRSGACRIYVYPGAGAAGAGQIIFFDPLQPAGQRPICVASPAAGDPDYAKAGDVVGHWPLRTTFEFDYWKEYPVTLINWTLPAIQHALTPHVDIAINLICPPRQENHAGEELPPQGVGAGPIGGGVPPQ